MKTFAAVLATCALFVFCLPNLQAQYTFTNQFSTTVSFGPSAVVGEPYSAVEETENKQTLADGTNIDQRNANQKIYRDSQGRTRTETFIALPLPNADASTPASILIADPVAGTMFMLNPREHTARQIGPPRQINAPAPVQRPVVVKSPVQPLPKRTAPTQEDLGSRMMDGLLVQGRKITTTIPTGAQGNDRPMSIVTETWYSEELKITILRAMSDPRNGVHTTRVTQIDRSEPDPSLFQIPADYAIVQQQQ